MKQPTIQFGVDTIGIILYIINYYFSFKSIVYPTVRNISDGLT